MQTGTLSGDSCDAYGAPATVAGTNVAQRSRAASATPTRSPARTTSATPRASRRRARRHERADAVGDRVQLQRPQPRLLGRRHLQQGLRPRQRSRQLHRHRQRRNRPRKRHRQLHLQPDRRHQLGAPAAGNYSFSAPTSGAGTANATNNAGLTGPNATFLAQVDSNPPTGGALTANGTAATGGGAPATSPPAPRCDQQPHRLHRNPDPSRVRPRQLHPHHADRQPLTGNSCGTYGAPADDHRHHGADRRHRQLLPTHPHRHRQRRQHRHDHDHRQGRHHRPVRADRLRLLGR